MGSSQRKEFVEYLARTMYEQGVSGVHFSRLYDLAREFSGYGDPTKLDYFDTDVRNCTFITRDSRGVYSFKHQSFMEYVCARAVKAEVQQHRPRMVAKRELSEGVLQFLGEMNFDEGDLSTLHAWSQNEDETPSSRMLSRNAVQVLVGLRTGLKGVAARRFGAIDDPWARIGEAVGQKDLGAFERVVENSYAWLLRYVQDILRSYVVSAVTSPEDVLQEVLIRLWSEITDENRPTRLHSRFSISRMIHMFAMDLSRRDRSLSEVAWNRETESRVEEFYRPDQEMHFFLTDFLNRAAEGFSASERQVLLGAVHGKTQLELANELSLSRTRVTATMQKLRRRIWDVVRG